MSRFPHFFTPSGAGDRLLAGASTAKIELHRWPNSKDEEPVQSVVEFELQGSIALTNGDAAELIAALLNEFRQPRQPRREGGASC